MSSVNYRFPSQYQQPGASSPAPTNMSSQRFCLRWNNHQSNLLSVFDQLLHDESFVDVTLAVEGQLLKAHKIVLSACSPYFQALFVDNPDKHPIVFLKDVPYSDMRSLLDFMYRGEVSVDQDRLTAFLRVAESLRIKGLTEVNEEKCDSITSSLQNQHMNSNLSHLQRLQPPKKFNTLNMLGSALLQPKRKRGRPRKLSGSSNGTPGADDFDRSDSLLQGSPEMLEVKMEMDGFRGNNSDSSSGNKEDDDPKLKDDGEPVAGTSKENFTNSSVKTENDFQAAESPITHNLLTPKIEMTEPQIYTPSDNINNNNNPTTASTSAIPMLNSNMNAPSGRQPVKRRARRRATSQSQDPAEQLTEMSVRGLNLFRYASINDGIYHCTECAKVDVQKTFKNKYSFQRHAFLYHEGHQRKVFPCPVCQKEFSRPDKMKNHMKTVHDCFMPKDCVFPMGFFLPPNPLNEHLNQNCADDYYYSDNNEYIENNQNQSNLTEVTEELSIELIPIKRQHESVIISTEAARNLLMEKENEAEDFEEKLDQLNQQGACSTGVHFLTDDENLVINENYERKKNELLEYITHDDGSVVCKLCGEVLTSRTHWYRHKYKFHVNNMINPTPIFKCKHCNIFFKSRKGFTGHVAARHGDNNTDLLPHEEIIQNIAYQEEFIAETLELPKCNKKKDNKGTEYEEQRVKEEKLVAAIIDRVRKECEAQGSAVSRRGYSRRNTVMMNST